MGIENEVSPSAGQRWSRDKKAWPDRKEKREAGQTVDDPPPVELFLQEYFTPNEEA